MVNKIKKLLLNRFVSINGFLTMKFSIMLLFVASMNCYAQQGNTITGTVTDKGEPLPGVNVSVKGTTIGMATNEDGKYEITIPSTGTVLVFSYIGYVTAERTVGNQRVINVEMTEDAQIIDEVVVVGYGTQRKVNLTGSVAAVTIDETISNRSVSNVSTALQGLLPGLAVSQNSGMAGNNSASLMIRGLGTVNTATPLIVVDGMPDVDIDRINMNDIESISVLKDAASSAVYGSRAANGVILITTRTGKNQDKTVVNLSYSHTWGVPINSHHFISNYPRVMELTRQSEASSRLESVLWYKKSTIDQWLALGQFDHLRFPNTDWMDVLQRTAITQNYNASASGGGDKFNFFASMGIMDEKGLQICNDYIRYTVRFNFDYAFNPYMNIGFRFSGNWSKYEYSNSDGFGGLRSIPAGITPYDPVTGLYGTNMAIGSTPAGNPYFSQTTQLNHQNRQELLPSAFFEWTPVKGLKARIDYAINYFNQFLWNAPMPMQGWNFQTEQFIVTWTGDNAGITNNSTSGYKTQMQTRLNYNKTLFDRHEFSLMVNYSEEYWYQRWLNAYRSDRLHPALHEINAALNNDNRTNSGRSETEGLQSVVGRFNYTGYDKYLLEVTMRADGSSRFAPGHQWGYFPSVSVGWRFTEEDFIKTFVSDWLPQGKIRVSYGSLGNNSSVGLYEQQETLTTSNYMVNDQVVKGFVNQKMINQSLSWESTSVTNYGMDLGFLKNRLNVELDYYDKLTTGMIRPSEMSLLLTAAYSAPRTNIGNMRNRGFEANLTWHDRIGKFNYSINANVAYFRNTLESWSEFLDKGYTFVDMPYHFAYAWQDYGLARTYQDYYNVAPQTNPHPGSIHRIDVNGDGLINGNDKVAYPQYLQDRPNTNYAMRANASWKGIDFSIMVTAATGRKQFWINDYNWFYAEQNYGWSWEHLNYPWGWDNPEGTWPRIGSPFNTNLDETTFWHWSMNYLRLKNIQLGYTLPKQWARKLFIDELRIYTSGENVATLTKFEGFDPEKTSVSNIYPLVKSFSAGINVKF